MIPPSIRANTSRRPRNRNRLIAYAAIDAKTTVKITVTTEVKALARYQFQMSPLPRIVAYDDSVRSQSFRIGPVPNADTSLGVSEVLIAHRLGISQSTEKNSSRTHETIVNVRLDALLWFGSVFGLTAAGAAAEMPVPISVLPSPEPGRPAAGPP